MGKGNIINDIEKGLYPLVIAEIIEIKKNNHYLSKSCDQLISLIEEGNKEGKKILKKEYIPLLQKIGVM